VDDVRVVEARRQLGLVDEHLHERRVVRQVREDPLDDEHALEARRALDTGLQDVGHAATPDTLIERVLAELDRLFEWLGHVVAGEGGRGTMTGESSPLRAAPKGATRAPSHPTEIDRLHRV